ncbi:MAG: AlpA family phage regulatory protein [Deltaproteobacteria bacterium]|nr:AlpA family phage regulatory protein [Deltaproteobacteria bacterium]
MTPIELESSIGNNSGRTNHRIMRLPEVKAITGLSRSTIYFRIALGTFPKQVPLGGRTVGWLEAEIQNWLHEQVEASRQPGESNSSWN